MNRLVVFLNSFHLRIATPFLFLLRGLLIMVAILDFGVVLLFGLRFCVSDFMNKLTEKAIFNRIASGLSSFRIGRYVSVVHSFLLLALDYHPFLKGKHQEP